ncbi:hypothetical protein SLA2020_448870 [Shorea laevis]
MEVLVTAQNNLLPRWAGAASGVRPLAEGRPDAVFLRLSEEMASLGMLQWVHQNGLHAVMSDGPRLGPGGL